MKKNADKATLLANLLAQLRKTVETEELAEHTPLEHLVYAFLAWNTTRNQADQAFRRLRRAFVDLNELRVSDPIEIADILGSRYAKVDERAQRLVLVLNGVYRVEHAMEMERISAMPKREARATLEVIEGMVPFVSASVLLLGLGAHAIPVDDQLVARLKADGVVDDDADVPHVQSFLEHQIRADGGVEAHQLLRAYAERAATVDLHAPARKPSRRTKKTTASRTRKASTRSKASTRGKTTTRKKTTKKKAATRR